MATLYTQNLATLGITLPSIEEQLRLPMGSTDMGNVSYTVPAIHPLFAIPTHGGNHTLEFAKATATDGAHQKTWIAAKAMAWTALDLFLDPNKLKEVQTEFETVNGKRPGVYVDWT